MTNYINKTKALDSLFVQKDYVVIRNNDIITVSKASSRSDDFFLTHSNWSTVTEEEKILFRCANKLLFNSGVAVLRTLENYYTDMLYHRLHLYNELVKNGTITIP